MLEIENKTKNALFCDFNFHSLGLSVDFVFKKIYK